MRTSNACPQCLASTDGVWRLKWKLPWTFACVDHGAYLVHECAVCGARLQSNILDRRQQHRCCATDADAAERPRKDGGGRVRRHADDICGARISEIEASPSGPEALTLQSRIHELLDATGIAATPAAARLAELRRPTTFMLYVGTPGLLSGADERVQERFAVHFAERDIEVKRRGVDSLAQDRQYSLPITDPLLAAGAMTAAARLVYSDDLHDLPESAWQEILARSRVKPDSYWPARRSQAAAWTWPR